MQAAELQQRLKEGIAGFTRTLARDMVDFDGTANAIRPLAAWRGTKEMTERMAKMRPEDIAVLVTYLASEQANHINGCIFEVWHGHVGIFQEPPPLERVIQKEGSWTVEELVAEMPQSLTKNKSREVFPDVMRLG